MPSWLDVNHRHNNQRKKRNMSQSSRTVFQIKLPKLRTARVVALSWWWDREKCTKMTNDFHPKLKISVSGRSPFVVPLRWSYITLKTPGLLCRAVLAARYHHQGSEQITWQRCQCCITLSQFPGRSWFQSGSLSCCEVTAELWSFHKRLVDGRHTHTHTHNFTLLLSIITFLVHLLNGLANIFTLY